jgi:hypothetical protein
MTSTLPSFTGTLESFYWLQETEKKGKQEEMCEDEYSLPPS